MGRLLLVICGVLYAAYALLNFFMQGTDGFPTLRTSVQHRGTVVEMGIVALAAGVCTMAAAYWSSRKSSAWLLAVNGFACSLLGLILTFWKGRLQFSTIALLIVVMAVSVGVYQLAIARTSWLLKAAGVASVAFALAFLAFLFGWIKLDPGAPAQSLYWLGSYFAFSAACMLWLSSRPGRSPL